VEDGTEPPEYIPSSSKGTAIRNPVMRYLEKIVSNTILGRFESGAVGEKQLYIMYSMFKEFTVNIAAHFIQHVERVAKRENTRGIMIRGMVTMISQGLGIDLRGMQHSMISEGLTYNQLIRMEFLSFIGNIYCLKQDKGAPFPLPAPELTTLQGRRKHQNLAMASPNHSAVVRAFYRENRDGVEAVL